MQTTRLHISGLTPSITERDLTQRFSTFGDVRGVDGVGKLDGLGQPRKFAYVTLETTQPKLSRCMNLLSGATWKGAKLRIGEAKPDYRARHELEINPPPRAPRPKMDAAALKRARLKRRLKARRLLRGTQGREMKDMSLVTLDNVSERKGWRRTPLDHLIRPLRMRPLHPIPLPPKRQQPKKSKLKKTPTVKKKEKRKFDLTRARCTVIDPARYGAVHLTAGGGILGADLLVGGVGEVEIGIGMAREEDTVMMDEVESTLSSGDSDGEPPKRDISVEKVVVPSSTPSPARSPTPPPVQRAPTPPPAKLSKPVAALQPEQQPDPLPSLAKEKADVLALLGGMFSNDDDWGGRESLSGDEELPVADGEGGEEVGYEVVPREGKVQVNVDEDEDGNGDEDEGEHVEEDEEVVQEKPDVAEEGEVEEIQEDESSDSEEPDAPTTQDQIQHTTLKDMFKPQEESAGFSLGLDIDLDPDAESFLPASLVPPSSEPTIPLPPPPSTSQPQTQAHAIQYTPDPREIMFFPSANSKRDVFSVIREKGWEWPHPGTSDEIRAKWDARKAELTREYTRRHREGVKRRRRGGTGRLEDI